MDISCRPLVLLYINVDDFDILKRLISLVNFNVFNGMDDFKPSNRPAKDGVLVVQPGGRGSGDKPLGTIVVWLAWIRHGHCVWAGGSEGLACRDERTRGLIGEGRRVDVPIVLQIRMELIFEIVSPNRLAARAVSQRVTSLNHLSHAPRAQIAKHQRPPHSDPSRRNDSQTSQLPDGIWSHRSTHCGRVRRNSPPS
jgi:hypothetical protein